MKLVSLFAPLRRQQLARYLRHGEQQWFWSLPDLVALQLSRQANALVWHVYGSPEAALVALDGAD